MPEPVTPVTPVAEVTPTSDGSNPDKAQTPAAQSVDFSKLSDEQLNKALEDPRIWQTERLSKLREAEKKAKTYEADQAKAAEDKLIKEKKFDEVLATKEAKIQELLGQIQSGQLDNSIRDELAKAGVKNIAAGLKLIDRANLKIGEGGKIDGLDEAIKGFSQQYPELISKGSTSVGSPTNPGNISTGEPVKMSNLRDPAWYNNPANAETIKNIQLGKIQVTDD